jgi:hypothetical protein
MSFDEEAATQASTQFRREVAKMVAERPGEVDEINSGLAEAFGGHPQALCLAAMADALSHVLSEFPAQQRAVMVMAFADMTLQMATIRDEIGSDG